MIVCPECGAQRAHDTVPCVACASAPAWIDGIFAWSPALAQSGSGFKAEYFEPLAAAEETSFWFVARNKLLVWALRTYFPGFDSLLEIGCGTGFVLKGISDAFPSASLTGSEIFCSGLSEAAKRVPNATLLQMDARKLPFDREFDVIGAFDVLEHIDDDRRVLENMFRALKPGGGIIVTVPQHPFLWSRADTYACHERRYERAEMAAKVREAGFRIARNTSFVSLLLPAMAASRYRNQTGHYDPMDEMRIAPPINRVMGHIMTAERSFIRLGIDFPAGGSRLVVAVKPDVTAGS